MPEEGGVAGTIGQPELDTDNSPPALTGGPANQGGNRLPQNSGSVSDPAAGGVSNPLPAGGQNQTQADGIVQPIQGGPGGDNPLPPGGDGNQHYDTGGAGGYTGGAGPNFTGPWDAHAALDHLPLLFFLAFTLLFISLALLARSGQLLRSLEKDESEGVEGEHHKPNAELQKSQVGYVLVYMGCVCLLSFTYVGLNAGFQVSPQASKAFVTEVGLALLRDPNRVAGLFFVMTLGPALLAMLDFALFASLAKRAGRDTYTASPIVGIFGAVMAFVSLIGSVASVWGLYLACATAASCALFGR